MVFSTSARERNSIGLLSILLRLCRERVERSGRFILSGFQESVQHVSVIIRLDQLFLLESDVAYGVSRLNI